MKKLTQSSVLVVAVMVMFAAVQSIHSQEKKEDKKADAKKSEKSEKKADTKNDGKNGEKRLPNFYGQIGLNDEQKDKVYAIQEKYEPQIAELREKLKDLQKKRDDEARGVLTDDQKTRLDAIWKGNKGSNREQKGSKSPFRRDNPDGKGSKKATEPAEKKTEAKPAEKKVEKK